MSKKKELTPKQQLIQLTENLSPATKNRIANTLKNFSRLKGKDKTYAIASTFGSILNDSGKLKGTIDRNTFNSALQAFDLGANWKNMSDIQRFVSAGKNIVNTSNQYAKTKIPYAGDTLSLASLGYSQYQMVNNWNQYSDVDKIVGIANTITNVDTAYNIGSNVFATGASGASGTTGAVVGSANAVSGATASMAAPTVGDYLIDGAGYVAAAYAAYNLYEGYGQGGASGRMNGAANGAAIGALFGPWGAAIGAGVGLIVGSVKTGKSAEQQKRDAYRDYFTQVGVFQKSNKDITSKEGYFVNNTSKENFGKEGWTLVELADGTYNHVGEDGSKGRAKFQNEVKTVYDPSRVMIRDADAIADTNGELRPYNIDYTNPLDMTSRHGLLGLNYIMGGGSEKAKKTAEYDHTIGMMVNASTSNASSREFNQDNFNISMQNIRHFYSKAGITNSDQAYNMLNQLKAEGKVSEQEFEEASRGLRIAFNNDYEYANQLDQDSRKILEKDTVGYQDSFVNTGEPLDQVRPLETSAVGTAIDSLSDVVKTEKAEDGINTTTTFENGTQATTLIGKLEGKPTTDALEAIPIETRPLEIDEPFRVEV